MTAPIDLPPPRVGVFRRAWRGVRWLGAAPVEWAGVSRIRTSWGLIRELGSLLRHGPSRQADVLTEGAGHLDLEGTARRYGLTVPEMQGILARRRRETARAAYACAALGLVFLAAWLWTALTTAGVGSRLFTAMTYLPFCFVALLSAYYNALLNFQVRVGRVVSWREHFSTSEPFWPS